MIKVVLLKSFQGLGKAGSVVNVKKGYANNFLIPNGVALVANAIVMKKVTEDLSKLSQQDKNMREDALKLLQTLEGKKVVVIKPSSEDGTLYGSVSNKDIYDSAIAINPLLEKFLTKNSVRLSSSIKSIGKFKTAINIYDNIDFRADVIVARSQDEANELASAQ